MQTINVFEEDLHPAIEKVRLSRGDEVNADYQRWSLVLSMLRDGDDLLDIGIGRGQFPDAAVSTNMFGRVRGADRKQHSLYRNDNQFEYVEYDLTTPPPAELRAQVVTCLECIEHIADPGFDAAVRNLLELALERLIVTVPFEEKEPLPPMHKQRFTAERLGALFPGCRISLLAKRAGFVRWALVEWTRPEAV